MEEKTPVQRKKRRNGVPPLYLFFLILPFLAAGFLLLASGSGGRQDPAEDPVEGSPSQSQEPDVPSDTERTGPLREEDREIWNALTLVLEKNPETKDYVWNFRTPLPYPDSVDLQEELSEGGVPLLMQWDQRWGYCAYGAGLIGYTGCGPTCLSMVLLGLTGDETYNPAYVAKFAIDNGYCVAGHGTAWTLFSEGAEALGLTAKELPLWESTMAKELEAGRPIICIMGPGDFTDSGHYIVLTDYADGVFSVLDPNRTENCRGWTYEDLEPQIQNLWSYTY